jgi:hypothetical protein
MRIKKTSAERLIRDLVDHQVTYLTKISKGDSTYTEESDSITAILTRLKGFQNRPEFINIYRRAREEKEEKMGHKIGEV